MSRIEEEYAGYRVLAAEMGGIPTARAFRPGGGSVAFEAMSHSLEAAVAAVKSQIGQEASEPDGWEVPTRATYAKALRFVYLSPGQHRMVAALCAAGDAGLDLSALARAGGYDTDAIAGELLGALAVTIAAALHAPLPQGGAMNIIATGTDAGWVMHPELRAAFSEQET